MDRRGVTVFDAVVIHQQSLVLGGEFEPIALRQFPPIREG